MHYPSLKAVKIWADWIGNCPRSFLMLGLHYVPGSHGSHGSQKRSSPWCCKSFLSLYSSSVKSRYVFSRSAKICRDRGSPARYGLSRMVLRFLPACHLLWGPLTFCYVAIKFCYVYQVLPRFSTMKHGRWMVFEPQYAYGIKRRFKKLLQSLYYTPLIKNIITCNGNEEADFVFI